MRALALSNVETVVVFRAASPIAVRHANKRALFVPFFLVSRASDLYAVYVQVAALERGCVWRRESWRVPSVRRAC